MTRLTLTVALMALAAGSAGFTMGGRSGRVLYLTHSQGFKHDVLPLSRDVLQELARKAGTFSVTASEDCSLISEAGLRGYDAVVFYTTGELPLDDGQRRALMEFVQSGRGFVGIHSATDTFYKWPEYGEMIGGYFDGHPWNEAVTVRVEDRRHPATRYLDERFEITDEIYQFREWSRDRVNVLLSLDPASVNLAAPGVHRDDRDFALAWTRRFGDGRVFYTALGHSADVWRDPRFQAHLQGGILWAMGAKDGAEQTGAGEWRSLFDGRSTAGWRAYRGERMPEGWQVVDGALTLVGKAGDIVTTETFGDFELEAEWKVPRAGNSGIFYRVDESAKEIWHHAHEMQVLDNAAHADGKSGLTSAGSAYALYAPARDVSRPAGEWNQTRIVARGGRIEHWLNGEKVVEFEIGSPDWTSRVAASKFRVYPRFGRIVSGPIGLQDHGDRVQYRNIRIRPAARPE